VADYIGSLTRRSVNKVPIELEFIDALIRKNPETATSNKLAGEVI